MLPREVGFKLEFGLLNAASVAFFRTYKTYKTLCLIKTVFVEYARLLLTYLFPTRSTCWECYQDGSTKMLHPSSVMD